jgi:hypothetical protein
MSMSEAMNAMPCNAITLTVKISFIQPTTYDRMSSATSSPATSYAQESALLSARVIQVQQHNPSLCTTALTLSSPNLAIGLDQQEQHAQQQHAQQLTTTTGPRLGGSATKTTVTIDTAQSVEELNIVLGDMEILFSKVEQELSTSRAELQHLSVLEQTHRALALRHMESFEHARENARLSRAVLDVLAAFVSIKTSSFVSKLSIIHRASSFQIPDKERLLRQQQQQNQSLQRSAVPPAPTSGSAVGPGAATGGSSTTPQTIPSASPTSSKQANVRIVGMPPPSRTRSAPGADAGSVPGSTSASTSAVLGSSYLSQISNPPSPNSMTASYANSITGLSLSKFGIDTEDVATLESLSSNLLSRNGIGKASDSANNPHSNAPLSARKLMLESPRGNDASSSNLGGGTVSQSQRMFRPCKLGRIRRRHWGMQMQFASYVTNQCRKSVPTDSIAFRSLLMLRCCYFGQLQALDCPNAPNCMNAHARALISNDGRIDATGLAHELEKMQHATTLSEFENEPALPTSRSPCSSPIAEPALAPDMKRQSSGDSPTTTSSKSGNSSAYDELLSNTRHCRQLHMTTSSIDASLPDGFEKPSWISYEGSTVLLEYPVAWLYSQFYELIHVMLWAKVMRMRKARTMQFEAINSLLRKRESMHYELDQLQVVHMYLTETLVKVKEYISVLRQAHRDHSEQQALRSLISSGSSSAFDDESDAISTINDIGDRPKSDRPSSDPMKLPPLHIPHLVESPHQSPRVLHLVRETQQAIMRLPVAPHSQASPSRYQTVSPTHQHLDVSLVPVEAGSGQVSGPRPTNLESARSSISVSRASSARASPQPSATSSLAPSPSGSPLPVSPARSDVSSSSRTHHNTDQGTTTPAEQFLRQLNQF